MNDTILIGDVVTPEDREKYLNQELNKFNDSGGVTFNFNYKKGEEHH